MDVKQIFGAMGIAQLPLQRTSPKKEAGFLLDECVCAAKQLLLDTLPHVNTPTMASSRA